MCVIWYFTKKLCMRRDVCTGALSWWSCQSPVAHSCSLLNHLNSFRGRMFKINTKFDADSLLCSLNGVYHPHWLVQWSRHCPRTRIPVCSPWLPGYIDATQSVLVILILGVLFLDRTHQHVFLVVKLTLFISLMWCLPIFSIVKWLFLPL